MNKRIPCELIQDLLPLYIDEVTSGKTNDEIKDHLAQCDDCRIKYDNMASKINNTIVMTENYQNIEVDYLKKVKKNNRKKVVAGIVGSTIIVFIFLILKFFVWGFEVSNINSDIKVVGKEVTLNGSFYDASLVYSRHKLLELEGEKNMVVYACLPSFWNNNRNFNITIRLDQETIDVYGDKITSEGKIITKKAMDLYKSKNPYIGNMSANGAIARVINIYPNLGAYKNSLQTIKEPYGWTLEFQENIPKSTVEKFNKTMESYGYILLALIDNCGVISWEYESEGERYKETLTAGEASDKLGVNIKNYSESAEKVQELLGLMGIKE